MSIEQVIKELHDVAAGIAAAGINGFGNRVSDAADRLDAEVRRGPVAWVIPGDDNARDDGFLDAMAWQSGEFTKPLYAAPQPAIPEGCRVVWCAPTEHDGRIVYEHTDEPMPGADSFRLYAAAPPPPSGDAGKEGG